MRRPWHLFGDDSRVGRLLDFSRFALDIARANNHPRGSGVLRQIEHHVLQNTLANGAKAARARAMLDRLVRDGAQRFWREHELEFST